MKSVVIDPASEKKERFYLSKNPILRYIAFSILYVAQGIPEGITFYAIPAWLAMHDKTPIEIGSFLAVIGLPWSFKILIAPLMDRYTILSMGRKRPWVIFGQLGLILSFLSIGFIPDPVNNLTGLMICGFFISFFGAFQDVATDGMAVDVIPVPEQARVNGVMWGSKVVGTSVSLIIGTSLINSIGFSSAISAMSISILLIIIIPIIARERPGEKLMPWTSGQASPESVAAQLRSWKSIFKNVWKAIKLPSSIFLCFALFTSCIVFGMMDTILPLFSVQELGLTNTEYSHVFSTTAIIGGIAGFLAGGPLVDFLGKKRMVTLYLLSLSTLFVLFSLNAQYWDIYKVLFSFMLFYMLGYTFSQIALFATGMQLCWRTVAATQFTLFMSVGNIGRSIGSWLSGILKENLSWELIFICLAILPIIAICFIYFLHFKKHEEAIRGFEEQAG